MSEANKKPSLALYGVGFDGKPRRPPPRGVLFDKFVVPPFSVLNARDGYWQKRKKLWISMGIRPAAGRVAEGDDQEFGKTYNITNDYIQRKKATEPGGGGGPNSIMRKIGPKVPKEFGTTGGGFSENIARVHDEDGEVVGTSMFDPVLCELIYKWFCLPNGRILDPFAGESTKGIVAEVLGYRYTGVELRQEQINANRKQADAIGVAPNWIQGDSAQLATILPKRGKYDFVWTSPPYYDLEIYSESEKDGSVFETYEKFMAWYEDIFAQAVARLREDSFLAVKVGEIRDRKTGAYRNFVGDNITCFRRLGLHYYNEIILMTSVASLSVRVTKQFQVSRKIGKSHQNILVFWKGDLKNIRDVMGPVGVS